MKSPQARGVETRRLYAFESSSKNYSSFANRQRSLPFLRTLAGAVWRKHGRTRQATPSIAFGEGTPHGNQKVSFCEGRNYIELAETQRDVKVLLHELTHALGYGNPHGKGFVRKYFDLLEEYGRCDRGALLLDAALFKLKL